MISILELRKKKFYRFLESFLAIISIGFLILLVILAWLNPTIYSILLIIYSFLWLLKFCLNVFYTIFSFKESNRWKTFDFTTFFGQDLIKDKQTSDQISYQNSHQNIQKTANYQNKIESKIEIINLEILNKSEQILKTNGQKYSQEKVQIEEIHDQSLAQISYLQEFSHKFKTIGWSQKIQKDLEILTDLANKNSKFQPKNIWHLPIFAVYNEPSSVLIRSLRKILENNYDLSQIIVIISQEGRAGVDFNKQIRKEIGQENWLETYFEVEIEKVENSELSGKIDQKFEQDITNSQKLTNKLKIEQNNQVENQSENQVEKVEKNLTKNLTKLQVYFTEHPDGLVGEIKGKASNEDWGARFGTKILEKLQVDKELVLATSLDADSYLKKGFFRQLSYRFCATPDRQQAAFQPVHNYNHNFFEIGFWPRLVATQTTFYNLTNLALEGQISTFAIYSVPLTVLEKVDFWVREVIAEDSLLFLKSLVHFDGNFRVIPFYGQMEADSVEHHDYLEEIISQYRQLQRWAWGGVEGFPYLFWQFFCTSKGKLIDTRVRLKWIYLLFSNHFFWATTPLIFGLGPFLPNFLHGNSFMSTSVSQNLATFSQFFAWISFIFTFVFGYLTIVFIALKNSKFSEDHINNNQDKINRATQNSNFDRENRRVKLTWSQFWAILVQITISPFIYFLMAVPALDVQIRGLLGNYLGYWVTPKK